jgi:DNA-binding TFAR19-related protein (PDSD5 family)
MPSSGILRRVALVRTDLSEESSATIIRVTRIGELNANIVPSSLILVTLMMEALSFSETSVLTRTTRRNTPEDGILHSHRRENLKS